MAKPRASAARVSQLPPAPTDGVIEFKKRDGTVVKFSRRKKLGAASGTKAAKREG